MVLLGVVIGKCEMSSARISQENKHAYLWSNVNLCRTPSDKQQWSKNTFFLIVFDRNIIKSYLNIYLLFCVQQLILCD